MKGLKLPTGKSFELAKEIAELVINENHTLKDFPALYFHNKDLETTFNRKPIKIIGNHIFYK